MYIEGRPIVTSGGMGAGGVYAASPDSLGVGPNAIKRAKQYETALRSRQSPHKVLYITY